MNSSQENSLFNISVYLFIQYVIYACYQRISKNTCTRYERSNPLIYKSQTLRSGLATPTIY